MEIAVFQVLEGLDALFRSIYGIVAVTGAGAVHALDNAAGFGEKAGHGPGFIAGDGGWADLCFCQPVPHLLKGEDTVYSGGIFLNFRLFGDAGPDKDHIGVGVLFLDQLAMSVHGGDDRSQTSQHLGVIFLDEFNDGRTAGGNDHILFGLTDDPLIFRFDDMGAHRRLFGSGKPQTSQQLPHLLNPLHREIHNKGRGDTGDDLAAFRHGLTDLSHIIADHLGVLGTGNDTAAAKDTLVLDDSCLLAGKLNGFYRTFPDAPVTVFAVGFFQAQDLHGVASFPFEAAPKAALF